MQEGLLARLLAAAQFVHGKRRDLLMQFAVMRAHAPVVREHLVIGAVEHVMLIGAGAPR